MDSYLKMKDLPRLLGCSYALLSKRYKDADFLERLRSKLELPEAVFLSCACDRALVLATSKKAEKDLKALKASYVPLRIFAELTSLTSSCILTARACAI